MSVRINLTKKGKIGILAIVMLVLAGSGGYLLWRVNQENTVSPTDSDAGSSDNGTCWACCGSSTDVSCPTLTQDQKDSGWACSSGGLYCNSSAGCTGVKVKCGDGVTIPTKLTNPDDAAKAKACTNCNHSAPGSTTPVNTPECNVGSQCTKKCYWPEVAYCNADGTCSCKSGSSNGCTDTAATCTPVCNGTSTTAECSARCGGCNNLYYVKKSCDVNTCDSGTWITQPTGVYAHCAAISYSVKATDSDGIDESSISVKLNDTSRTTFSKSTSGTSTTISETLSGSNKCLAAGSYTLNMSWKDKKGVTSTNCAVSTTFTVQSEQTNPDWSMTKGVVEKCIDENTQNPTSQLTYTITIKNVGTAEGSISKIVDTLDTKVKSAYIGDISNSGAYASGKITWTLSSTDKVFAINQQKVFTYTITLPKDAFGKYQNTVTAYPTTGDTLTANANITANCTEAPQTGIFDTTLSKIALGLLLIVVGITFNRVSTGFIHIYTWGKKVKISMNEMRETRRIKKFEKRVVKR